MEPNFYKKIFMDFWARKASNGASMWFYQQVARRIYLTFRMKIRQYKVLKLK